MKHLLLIGAIMTISAVAHAQNSTDFDEKATRKKTKIIETVSNQFEGTEMVVTKEQTSFTNLPDMPKPTWAVITNSEGEFIKQSKIDPTNSVIDIHRLSKGLYFVTLVYRNKSLKAFTLNVEE